MVYESKCENGFVFSNLIRLYTLPWHKVSAQNYCLRCNVTVYCVTRWFSVRFTAGAVIADFITLALNSHWIILGIMLSR